MTTALLGGVSVLESNSDNQDWVSAGGDPENIDTDNFTTIEWFNVKTEQAIDQFNVEIGREIFPGFFQIATPLGEYNNLFPVKGFVTSLSEKNRIKKFVANHGELSQEPVYLVSKHGTDEYDTFYDDTLTEREYAKGLISGFQATKSAGSGRWDISFNFEVTWDGT